MQFSIDRDELLRGLYLTQGIVKARLTVPILSHVLIDANQGKIAISATDQEIGVRTMHDADVQKPGSLAANGRKLYEICRTLPPGLVNFSTAENHWIHLSAEKSKFKIIGLDPKEFPAMPTAKGTDAIAMPAETLRGLLAKTAFASSQNDDQRITLCGVVMESPEHGQLRLVATNAHRLSLVNAKVDGQLLQPAIVPNKGVAELVRLLESAEGNVGLQLTDGVLHAHCGSVDLSMRLVEGEPVQYAGVIPAESKYKITFLTESLLATLRRIATVSNEHTRSVKLSLEIGKLTVSSMNPDVGEAEEELAVEYVGTPLAIGFNSQYLIEGLSVLGGEAEIELNDEVRPATFRSSTDTDFLYVAMPMRLN